VPSTNLTSHPSLIRAGGFVLPAVGMGTDNLMPCSCEGLAQHKHSSEIMWELITLSAQTATK
jgi:hypothetical protein